MEDFADRHIHFLRGDRIDLFVLIETEVIVMIEKHKVMLLAVPCAGQVGRNVVGSELSRHSFWVSDVTLISDSTIFSILHEVMLIVEMEFIFVVNEG